MAIPISIHNQQLGVRLLELPPELVEVLQSETPPVLQLRSSESSSATQTPANAVLCTPDRSFEVRLVQSSNVLYILRQSTDSGFTSFAQCKSMLELVPSKADALDYVRQVLPLHHPNASSAALVSKSEFNDNAPFSVKELADAIKKSCVFEKDGHLWLPDPGVLVAAWKSILTAATITSTKLDQPWSRGELAPLVAEDDVDSNIYEAIVSRLDDGSLSPPMVAFDSTDATTWIGLTLLQSQHNPLQSKEFTIQWQDMLPESWRSLAKLDLLTNKYRLSDDGLISVYSRSGGEADATTSALPPKSKWHQKFSR